MDNGQRNWYGHIKINRENNLVDLDENLLKTMSEKTRQCHVSASI